MRVPGLFKGVRYVGEAEGVKKTYAVFETENHYLVLGPAKDGYYLNIVDRDVPGVIARVFAGRKVTSKQVSMASKRPDLRYSRLAALNALYVMVALHRARKLKRRRGKALVFKIR